MKPFNDRVNQDLITNILTLRGAEQAQVDNSRMKDLLNEEKTLRQLEEERKKQDIILKSGHQETMDRFKTKRTMASINTLLKRLKTHVANKRNITSELNSLLRLVDRDVQLDDNQKRNIVKELQGLKLDERGYTPSQTIKFVQLGNRIVEGLFDPTQSSLGTDIDGITSLEDIARDPRINRGQSVDEMLEQAYEMASRQIKSNRQPTKGEIDAQMEKIVEARLGMIADEEMAREIMQNSPPQATDPNAEMAMMGEEELPSQRLNIASLPSTILSRIKNGKLDELKDIADRMGVDYGHAIGEDTLRNRLLDESGSMSKDRREIRPQLILDEINIASKDELRQLAKTLRIDLKQMRNIDQMRHRLRQAIAMDFRMPSRNMSVKERTDPLRGNPSDNTPSAMRRLEESLRDELELLGFDIQARENRSGEEVQGFDEVPYGDPLMESRARHRGKSGKRGKSGPLPSAFDPSDRGKQGAVDEGQARFQFASDDDSDLYDDEESESNSHLQSALDRVLARASQDGAEYGNTGMASEMASKMPSEMASEMPSGIGMAGDGGDEFMGADESGQSGKVLTMDEFSRLSNEGKSGRSRQGIDMGELQAVLDQRKKDGRGKGVMSIKALDKVVSEFAHELASMVA